MKTRFLKFLAILFTFTSVISINSACLAEEKIDSPPMTTWMPEIGQTHEIGYLAKSDEVNWISTWTTDSDQAAGSLLKTNPISLNKGKYSVLFQVWHRQDAGVELGELRAWAGDKLIASKPLISEEFTDLYTGGFQRAMLKIDLGETTKNLSFELYYGGNNNYIWTGAVNLTPLNTKRPFYNIAHRCSTKEKVNRMVARNANAIEFDVTPVNDNGNIEFTVYHSGDFFYTKKHEFNEFVMNLKSHFDSKKIALIELDCKQDESIDPALYAKELATRLINAGIKPEHSLFSVPKEQAAIFKKVLKDKDENGKAFFDAGIDSYLMDYSGLTAESWSEKVEQIGSTFIGVGATSVLITQPMPTWMDWIQAMTNRRDRNKNFKKTYYWTLNNKTSMRKCLDYGVDGVITNFPARMDEVLKEEPYASIFRLATQEDSQFKVHGFE